MKMKYPIDFAADSYGIAGSVIPKLHKQIQTVGNLTHPVKNKVAK
jgi:hypothetical protein